MSADDILTVLVRINLVAGVAIVVVLLIRPWVRWAAGPRIAYWLWLIVPVAAVAGVLPARVHVELLPFPTSVSATEAIREIRRRDAVTTPVPEQRVSLSDMWRSPTPNPTSTANVFMMIWLLGAGAMLVRAVVSTHRFAADKMSGPALVGVFRPKLVLPADFDTRFNARERALILAHEQVHRSSGDTIVNAMVEVARCVNWFNPLVHIAANRVRIDQELSCDAAVIAAHAGERRAYALALLKSQVPAAVLPLGCAWTSGTGRMRERIELLSRPPLARRHAVAGAVVVVGVSLAGGYAAWAQQPERVVTGTVLSLARTAPPPAREGGSVRKVWCALAFGIAISGCERQRPVLYFAEGAVSVRHLDSKNRAEPEYELRVLEPGWLNIGFAPEPDGLMVPVREVPRTFRLRVERQEYTSLNVLDQMVSPLFGAEVVQQLREQNPEGAEGKLVMTRLVLESPDEGVIMSTGPFTVRVHGGSGGRAGDSSFSSSSSSVISSETRVLLATWVNLPWLDARRRGIGIGTRLGPDRVRITVDGVPVSAEEIGAVVQELLVEYDPETLLPDTPQPVIRPGR